MFAQNGVLSSLSRHIIRSSFPLSRSVTSLPLPHLGTLSSSYPTKGATSFLSSSSSSSAFSFNNLSSAALLHSSIRYYNAITISQNFSISECKSSSCLNVSTRSLATQNKKKKKSGSKKQKDRMSKNKNLMNKTSSMVRKLYLMIIRFRY